MTGVVEIFVGLLLAVAVLALLARKLHVPYPIRFVTGGLLLGLIPKLPKVRLDEIAARDPVKTDALQRLRIEYEDRIRQLEAAQPESAGAPLRLFSSEFERLSDEALREERRAILQLRNEGVINDEVLRRIQRDLDLAEARLRQRQ